MNDDDFDPANAPDLDRDTGSASLRYVVSSLLCHLFALFATGVIFLTMILTEACETRMILKTCSLQGSPKDVAILEAEVAAARQGRQLSLGHIRCYQAPKIPLPQVGKQCAVEPISLMPRAARSRSENDSCSLAIFFHDLVCSCSNMLYVHREEGDALAIERIQIPNPIPFVWGVTARPYGSCDTATLAPQNQFHMKSIFLYHFRSAGCS